MKTRYYWSFVKDAENYDNENWDVASCVEEARQYNKELDDVYEKVYVGERRTNLPKLSNISCYDLKTGNQI